MSLTDAPPATSVGSSVDIWATVLLILPSVIGLLCGFGEFLWLKSIKLDGHNQRDGGFLRTEDILSQGGMAGSAFSRELDSQFHSRPLLSEDIDSQLESMKNISGYISSGANSFLMQEYKYMAIYIIAFSFLTGFVVSVGTMFSFILGSITSIVCGYIGMRIAVYANVRTAHEAWKDLGRGFQVAIRAGSIMGFVLVSLGVLNLVVLVIIYRLPSFFGTEADKQRAMCEAIAGYGLGGSSIALFSRVGGGIYTKAADVGADLSGKNEYGMAEDDYRNPACIADNVGDNVGDVAGMGADLFGSLAESTCAALVIAGSSSAAGSLATSWAYLMYPVTISSTGILVGLLTVYIVRYGVPVKDITHIGKALKSILIVSSLLEIPVVISLSYIFLPNKFVLENYGETRWYFAMSAVLLGMVSGLLIGLVTEYYTSHSYFPVREISQTQIVSAATGIIYGMALGYMSTVVPILCLAASVCVAHQVCGMYGVALAALGMLSTLTMGLTIDAYGPIADNAGGIAEMAGLGKDVRSRTDALDTAGNTTAAIGKGYAIGSAALVSLALFGAFTVRASIISVDILDAWTFTGLLFGAMMPYAFSAMTMKSVGIAANNMVQECLEQFPKIIRGDMAPDYERCIAISTNASLREMIIPGALVILSPLVAGGLFGKNCTAGLLAGALVSGVQLAISASNSGGAWDNAKKYIESGALGPENARGSTAHKNAVTGDTVGDPLKDTSGPSLNILIKLSAIISLVFGSLIATKFSNSHGGPWWLSVASNAEKILFTQ